MLIAVAVASFVDVNYGVELFLALEPRSKAMRLVVSRLDFFLCCIHLLPQTLRAWET